MCYYLNQTSLGLGGGGTFVQVLNSMLLVIEFKQSTVIDGLLPDLISTSVHSCLE